MAVVGAYARIDASELSVVSERLEALEGVSTFALEEPGKVGVLIEAGSLDEAHARLVNEIEKLEGVQGVFPIYAHAEPEQEEGPSSAQGAADDRGTITS